MSLENTPSDYTSSTSVEAGTNNAKRLQTVFRVALQSNKQSSGFHPRRSHKKSRAGCLTCKKRRVKVRRARHVIMAGGTKVIQCDEQRPECSNCEKRDLRCCYPSEEALQMDAHSSSGRSSKERSSSTLFSLTLDNITRDIQETLNLGVASKSGALWNRNTTLPMSTVAFHTFVRRSTETIASPAIRNVMRTDMIQVSFTVSQTYSLLVFLATHLS